MNNIAYMTQRHGVSAEEVFELVLGEKTPCSPATRGGHTAWSVPRPK